MPNVPPSFTPEQKSLAELLWHHATLNPMRMSDIVPVVRWLLSGLVARPTKRVG